VVISGIILAFHIINEYHMVSEFSNCFFTMQERLGGDIIQYQFHPMLKPLIVGDLSHAVDADCPQGHAESDLRLERRSRPVPWGVCASTNSRPDKPAANGADSDLQTVEWSSPFALD
jgi:hypothetical protein